jgi:hypothetical protein
MGQNITAPAGIKSIQRGVIYLQAGTTNLTQTITAVNPVKTELRFLGSLGSVSYELPFGQLTNSTTITASRFNTAGGSYFSWELTEFY